MTKKVIFPLVLAGESNTEIVYPDEISQFGASEIVDGSVIAEYFGSLPLEEVNPE